MNILLRDLSATDLELVLAWRSIEKVYQWFYKQSRDKRALTWEEHLSWWRSRCNWKSFVIQINESNWTRDVGIISFSQLDHWCPEVGIYIGEVTLWGKGIGRQALILGLDWLRGEGYDYSHASILKSNQRSIKLFESVGFTRVGEAREGEWEYKMKLKE